MSISIRNAKDITRETTVEFADETATVVYYPYRITKSMLERSDEAATPIGKLAMQLDELVARWEILDDSGVPFPATAEVMAEFPTELLNAVMRKITEEGVPGEASGASSSTT